MATYPNQIAAFPTHVNITEIIDASHPNNIQSEVVAIETSLGTNPATSTSPSPSGTFVSTSTPFATVKERLANIETGVVADSHSQYLRKAGDTGNVITPSASTTKGLVVKAASGQTANLQEWQTSAGTVVTRIDSSGNLIGTASGNIPLSTVTTAGDLIVGTGSAAVNRVGAGAQGTVLYSNGTSLYWSPTIQGTQGVQGIQGTQGTTGSQGAQGTQGTTGPQGTQGLQGTTGSQGAQGTLGTQGTQGVLGLQGIQGITGFQGSQGLTGTQGLLGTQGVQGIAGAAAAQGIQGPQGTTGIQGFTGTQGTTGAGTQGTQGIQGTTGLQGLQGTLGIQGTTGTQGIMGTSILGVQQTSGSNYNLVLGDAYKLVELNNATAMTCTVPASGTTNYAINTSITLVATGAGQITVTPAVGVTINGTPGLKLRTQWSSATLIKRGTDTWLIVGDLSA